MLKIKTKAAALLAAAVLLAGCSQGAASVSSAASAETTPAPTATAAPTATPAETPAPAQLGGMFGGMVFPVLMFPAAFLYALSDLLVPELARSRAEGNRVRVQHLTQKCLRMGLLFAGAVAGGLFAGRDLLLSNR